MLEEKAFVPRGCHFKAASPALFGGEQNALCSILAFRGSHSLHITWQTQQALYEHMGSYSSG